MDQEQEQESRTSLGLFGLGAVHLKLLTISCEDCNIGENQYRKKINKNLHNNLANSNISSDKLT